MIKYPGGKEYKAPKTKVTLSHKSSLANRGMNLEDDINQSNDYYNEIGRCLIYKRPTPINIVKVDYSKGAHIVDAYFEKQSTTDYNGIYRGKYVDFEAKNTKSKTSLPLANIHKHQIKHLTDVIKQGGLAFFIVEFQYYNQCFLIDAQFIINRYESKEKKSISYEETLKHGIEIKSGFRPRLLYLDAVDQMFFN